MSSTEGLPYLEYCKGKAFLASKASEQTEANSMMKVKLETGDKDGKNGPMLGISKVSKELKAKGFQEGEPLGPGQIVLNDDIGLHHKMLAKEKFAGGWKAAYRQYGQMTKYGHLILAGTVENFQKWAKSQPCRDEVAGVEDGRLFAYVEHQEGDTNAGQGYIVALNASDGSACATIQEGRGYVLFHDGEVYHGELSKGRRHGHGTYTFSDGGKYVGEYQDDKRHGQGVHTFASGDKYEGQYKDGQKDGEGSYKDSHGSTYVGEWEKDKEHGQGSLTFPDGGKYVGEWENGNKHGQGSLTSANGKIYVGQWQDDKKHGKGCSSSPDGTSWTGPYVDDRRHGVGSLTNKDGTVVSIKYVHGVAKK